MFNKLWSMAIVLGLGCLILTGANAGDKAADDKKAVKKKKETPGPGGTLLNKSGELKKDDEKDAKFDSPGQKFAVKLTEGKTYQIDLKSKDFDAFLRVVDAQGKEVAYNDDAGPNTYDSRIVYKPAKSGDFKIVATTFDGKVGKFTLTAAELDKVATVGSGFQGKALELMLKDGKAAYSGAFAKTDAPANKRFFKIFTIQLEKDKAYRIDHKGVGDDSRFDPYLFLEDADGNTLERDDDGGGGLNARIVFTPAKAGAYRITATTLLPMQAGRYALEVGPDEEKKKAK